MASASTKASDLIVPEVLAQIIDATIEAENQMVPYAAVDNTLTGVPGNTVTVPQWNYVGDAEDVDVEGLYDNAGEMETSKLTAGQTTFTVKAAGKSVSILQTAVNAGIGDPIKQAGIQLGKSITGKVDSDLIDTLMAAPNVKDEAAAISYKKIVDAVCAFEDEGEAEKVMFIHPKQEAAILKDADFIAVDKLAGDFMVTGSIGKIAGCFVKKSKKVPLKKYVKDDSGTITIVADSTTESSTQKHLDTIQPDCVETLAVGDKVTARNHYVNPIIKLNGSSAETDTQLPALTIFVKKDTQVDAEWFPKKQRHDVTAVKYYGTALTNTGRVVLALFNA